MEKKTTKNAFSIAILALLIVICLFPTIFTFFFQNREFIDLGLLLSSIITVISILSKSKLK